MTLIPQALSPRAPTFTPHALIPITFPDVSRIGEPLAPRSVGLENSISMSGVPSFPEKVLVMEPDVVNSLAKQKCGYSLWCERLFRPLRWLPKAAELETPASDPDGVGNRRRGVERRQVRLELGSGPVWHHGVETCKLPSAPTFAQPNDTHPGLKIPLLITTGIGVRACANAGFPGNFTAITANSAAIVKSIRRTSI